MTDRLLPTEFPFPVHHSLEALPLDSRVRTIYPEDIYPNGNYVQLPYGRTRFWLLGPEDGVKLVLIHGLTTPAATWGFVAPYLAEHGFRVLVYDLYGKGYSEAPKLPFHTNLFITQLALLLQYVRWDRTHIAGFSMGGAIATAFAAMFPHLIEGKAILMASGGFHDRPASQVILPATEQPEFVPKFHELRMLQHELLPGYDIGVESCRLDGPIWGVRWAFNKLSTLRVGTGVPLQVLVIQGTDDPAVLYERGVEIHECLSGSEFVAIQGGEHDMVMREEHWKKVAEAILLFLRK